MTKPQRKRKESALLLLQHQSQEADKMIGSGHTLDIRGRSLKDNRARMQREMDTLTSKLEGRKS